MINRKLQIGLIAAAMLLAPFSTSTKAQPNVLIHEMGGDYLGTWQKAEGIDSTFPQAAYGEANLTVNRQLLAAFGGTLSLSNMSPEPHLFQINGTVIGDQANFFGLGGDSSAVSGVTLRDFGNGGAILDGWFRTRPVVVIGGSDPATASYGSLLLLRRFIGNPNEAPPNLTGRYAGFAVSEVTGQRRPMSARLVAEGTPGGPTGTGFTLSDVSMLPCIFPVGLGTINPRGRSILHEGVPATAYDVALIGQGEDENLQLTGEYHVHDGGFQPCVRGQYIMKHADGTEDHGTFEIDLQTP